MKKILVILFTAMLVLGLGVVSNGAVTHYPVSLRPAIVIYKRLTIIY